MMKVDMIKAIQKGITPLNTVSSLIFEMLEVMTLTTPTGGVRNPIKIMRMVTTPYQMPNNPLTI